MAFEVVRAENVRHTIVAGSRNSLDLIEPNSLLRVRNKLVRAICFSASSKTLCEKHKAAMISSSLILAYLEVTLVGGDAAVDEAGRVVVGIRRDTRQSIRQAAPVRMSEKSSEMLQMR
jgi:hypothetical protein